MISIIIHSVILEHKYEFILSENTPVGALVEEIGEMISQSEQFEPEPFPNKFLLYNMKGNYVLSPERTLKSYGIKTGDELSIC